MVARKLIYSFILLILITFKVSSAAVHNYLHHEYDDGHEEQCELCEHAIYHQNLEFPFSYQTEVPTNTTVLHLSSAPIGVKSLEVSSYSISQLFTRPPPSLSLFF